MADVITHDIHPVTFAVVKSGLLYAVAEMKAVVLRTAYSNLWKEAGDLSCGLLSSSGDLVVQGVGDIPVHLASMPESLRGCLDRIPPETLRPGDVLFQNDPYQGNNHLPDFLMAKPVFFAGQVVAYTAVRGHWVDIGGSGPGSYSTEMFDIFGEGLRLFPVRIYEEGVLNEDIVDVIRANTRNARERLGDLRSQYAGCVAAERRIIAYCDKYGADTVTNTMEKILDNSEILTRNAIKTIPDGRYEFTDYCDGDGVDYRPIRIAATVTVRDDSIHVDFANSEKQVRGGMNAPWSVTLSGTLYAIKCLTDPENPANSGSYRPISIEAPLGSVLNPYPPAPVVASNHEVSARVADTVVGALAQAVPDRVAAAGTGTSGVLILGTWGRVPGRADKEQGEESVHLETHGAGQGAHSRGDGVNALRVNVGNTGNTPTEVLENSLPVTVLRYEISEDGGGPGQYRGGTGIKRILRVDEEMVLTVAAERAEVPPYGLFGGHSAPKAEYALEFRDGTWKKLRSKTSPMRIPKGTVIHFRCAGGGGYGPVEMRSLELIQADLDDGYISPENARDLYGVELQLDPKRSQGSWTVGRRQKKQTK